MRPSAVEVVKHGFVAAAYHPHGSSRGRGLASHQGGTVQVSRLVDRNGPIWVATIAEGAIKTVPQHEILIARADAEYSSATCGFLSAGARTAGHSCTRRGCPSPHPRPETAQGTLAVCTLRISAEIVKYFFLFAAGNYLKDCSAEVGTSARSRAVKIARVITH